MKGGLSESKAFGSLVRGWPRYRRVRSHGGCDFNRSSRHTPRYRLQFQYRVFPGRQFYRLMPDTSQQKSRDKGQRAEKSPADYPAVALDQRGFEEQQGTVRLL